jgi:hypothetical protein
VLDHIRRKQAQHSASSPNAGPSPTRWLQMRMPHFCFNIEEQATIIPWQTLVLQSTRKVTTARWDNRHYPTQHTEDTWQNKGK